MFACDVRDGLSKAGQKELPCQYFYDEVGSALFEVITVLPEYGLTRADARLVRRLAPELAGYIHGSHGPPRVVELGSGSGTKTRWILESLAARGPLTYCPIDISVPRSTAAFRRWHRFAEIDPIEDSYLSGLRRAICPRRPGEPVLLLFLGSTIGNFERSDALEFLREIRNCLMPGDALLLGTDLVKPVERMLRAYDDPTGVTAAFNLNLLARINRELDGDFVLRNFAHEARYDESRIASRCICAQSRADCDDPRRKLLLRPAQRRNHLDRILSQVPSGRNLRDGVALRASNAQRSGSTRSGRSPRAC